MKITPAHVAVRTNDLEASRQFYVELLGFSVAHEFQGGENHLLFLQLESFTVELVHKPKNTDIGSTGVINHFAFDTDSIAAVKKELLAAGYPVTKEVLTPIDGKLLLFAEGPNGERVEFMETVTE